MKKSIFEVCCKRKQIGLNWLMAVVFVSPVFGLGIDGKSISNFNFAGDLKAGSLGPLDVLGVYQNTALSGKISWKEQSAKVFQSLFPQQWNWLIHEGSIKGQSEVRNQ